MRRPPPAVHATNNPHPNPRNHRSWRCREATDAVYLICNELSGDSSIIALSTMTGATLWSISTSSVAGALVPVRAAAAISGAFLYADTGSNVTALSTVDGALMWRVDVAQLVNSTVAGSSVTHMDVSEGGEVLLLRWVQQVSGLVRILDSRWDLGQKIVAGQVPAAIPPHLAWPALLILSNLLTPHFWQGVRGRAVLHRRPLLLPRPRAQRHRRPAQPAVVGRLP